MQSTARRHILAGDLETQPEPTQVSEVAVYSTQAYIYPSWRSQQTLTRTRTVRSVELQSKAHRHNYSSWRSQETRPVPTQLLSGVTVYASLHGLAGDLKRHTRIHTGQ